MEPRPTPSALSAYPHVAALAALAGKPVWIVDLEATTGDMRDPEFGVVEIGWVLVGADGSVQEGQLWTDPGFPMSPYAEKITGIARAMYAGHPTLAERWDLVGPLFHNSLVSGFGVNDLDCKALARAGAASGHPNASSKIHSLDARALWTSHAQTSKGKLSEVAAAFGHVDEGAHRALADARAAATALDGLVAAMGPEPCLAMARSEWNPAEAKEREKAIDSARALGPALDAALASCKGARDFDEGLRLLDAAGFRPHHSSKGFSWWSAERRAESDGAPNSPTALAEHFRSSIPARLLLPDSLDRCKALLRSREGADLDDDRVAALSLCKSSGTAGAARAAMIRDGSLPPWHGVPDELAALARSLPSCPAEERDIVAALREADPVSWKASMAINACAASLAAQARASQGPAPAKSRFPHPR